MIAAHAQEFKSFARGPFCLCVQANADRRLVRQHLTHREPSGLAHFTRVRNLRERH